VPLGDHPYARNCDDHDEIERRRMLTIEIDETERRRMSTIEIDETDGFGASHESYHPESHPGGVSEAEALECVVRPADSSYRWSCYR
jgi:hypothetical protein